MEENEIRTPPKDLLKFLKELKIKETYLNDENMLLEIEYFISKFNSDWNV